MSDYWHVIGPGPYNPTPEEIEREQQTVREWLATHTRLNSLGPSGSVTITQIEYDDLLARGERIALAIEANCRAERHWQGRRLCWACVDSARIARETM